MEADKERQARRTHLQRAILDLRNQQASELARDLLVCDRPKLSANTAAMLSAASARDVKQQPPRRAASARTDRDHQPGRQWLEPQAYKERDAYLLQLQEAEDMENSRRQADVEPPRAASADSRPRRRQTFERDTDRDGPRVMVTERRARPFTDVVRLQRPGVTRQNWERVRATALKNHAAAAAADVKQTSFDTAVSSDHRLPLHG